MKTAYDEWKPGAAISGVLLDAFKLLYKDEGAKELGKSGLTLPTGMHIWYRKRRIETPEDTVVKPADIMHVGWRGNSIDFYSVQLGVEMPDLFKFKNGEPDAYCLGGFYEENWPEKGPFIDDTQKLFLEQVVEQLSNKGMFTEQLRETFQKAIHYLQQSNVN